MVQAQGVPASDIQGFVKRLEIFRNMEEDADSQVEKAQKRAEVRDFEARQLESIDALIAAFEGQAGFLGDLDAMSSEAFPNAEQTYGPLANPAAGYVFGDARPDIEALIIAGAEQTYGLPGVSAAGLSPTQWRCLLQALIWQESRFNVGARSPAAAYGLTQIIPTTAQELGIYPAYYENPVLQVVGGGRYLAKQLNRFNGNIVHALAAYNAGPGAVMKYGGVPPYKETQHYVQVIPQRYNLYLTRVGGPDALGTIDPALYAVAEASLLSHGSMHYASYTLENAIAAMKRVRELVAQIGKTATVKESVDLNSMLRAELVMITAQRIKLEAAKTKSRDAQQQMILAMQRRAEAFLKF